MLPLPEDLPHHADVAVFGGSGFYEFLGDVETVSLDTPYGPPSEMPVIGEIGDRRVVFIPRHGIGHRIPAHRVNARANVWALAALGVQVVISPFAAGALRPDVSRGDLMVVDQIVDRTHSREGTFFDGPETFHLPFADPYDVELSALVADVATEVGVAVHRGGTVVVIPGPRFSSRAESAWYQQMGWDLVNMTQAPEVALVNEAGMRSVGIGMITDYDVGVIDDPSVAAVTQEDVFAVLDANAATMRSLLMEVIPRLPLREGGGDS